MDRNRKTAYGVLLEVEKNQAYSNLALNHFIQLYRPDNPPFVRELVYGVLENRIYLDYLLTALIPSGLRKVKKQDLTLLRMGSYQMLFMDSVPDYAAINETVKMARALCRGREGFINGVLRSVQKRGREVSLPDREKEIEAYLSVRYSAAPWIVNLWISAYGAKEAERLLELSQHKPFLSLRVNRMKTERQTLMGLLEKEGFQVEAGSLSDRVILVTGGSGILETGYFQDGLFSVQDQASVVAADRVNPKPGNLVVDVCAAPGGKTMAMAEGMNGKGSIFAFDIYEHKLELIEKQAERLNLNPDLVTTRCQDSRQVYEPLRGKADCVLSDVPCSGLGVLKRKPEIKYREEVDLEELYLRQRQILEASSAYVKIGGHLIYSTCTINPWENEEQVKVFLGKHQEFTLAEMEQILPEGETDGFFISRLIREA